MTAYQILAVFITFTTFTGYTVPLNAADAVPPTPSQARTGEITLTFTERSPASSRKELGRRLSLKESEMGDDYDLSNRPYKAYVPKNYDPVAPVGLLVYLNYKETECAPPAWLPVLEKNHLIFISPVCHHYQQDPPSVPYWQMLGLAVDAVHNLKRIYNIDPRPKLQLLLKYYPNDPTAAEARQLLGTIPAE